MKNYLETHEIKKLHLGAGPNVLDGWYNTDLSPVHEGVYVIDVTKILPCDDKTVDYILSEHLIEHLSYEEGCYMLTECYRILKPGGKIRVATPDLEILMGLHSSEKSEIQKRYIKWHIDSFLPGMEYNDCFVINNAFRGWGHQFIYDEKTLRKSMIDAGFTEIKRHNPGESDDENFKGIEWRSNDEIQKHTGLVLEAIRPDDAAPDRLQINHVNLESIHYRYSADSKNPFVLGQNVYSTSEYPYRERRKGFFVCSSGVCNLKCPYCITDQPQMNNNLSKEDFSFLFKTFGENIHFAFSGIGDFFCGYKKEDRLLSFLLQHDIIISYLDINGVDIRELEDPSLEGRGKISTINVSCHYGTMKQLKFLDKWAKSIKKIHENAYSYEIKMVISPLEKDIWDEAMLFYINEIQPITKQKLTLCPDTLVNLEVQYDELSQVGDYYKDYVNIYDKQRIFRGRYLSLAKSTPCPAGSRYFRVLNDGDIVPCELLAGNVVLGNLKRKDLTTFKEDVHCSYTGFCDCGWSANLGVRVRDGQEDSYLSQRYIGYKKMQESPLLPETNNIVMHIDRLEEGEKLIKIEGWAFANEIITEQNDICIVLKSPGEKQVLLTDRRIRGDVAAHFKDSNLRNSGFYTAVARGSLKPGQYKIGILVKNDNQYAFQYTDKTMRV